MEKYLFRGIHYLAGPALDLKFGDVLVEDGRIKKCGSVSADEAMGAVEFANGSHYVLVPDISIRIPTWQ